MLDPASSNDDMPPSGLETSAVEIGDVIHGKYKVERVIGVGGMGVVVAARHLTLDRRVAIKLLGTKSRENKEALERFTREARAAARIQSEHVGRVLDVDALPSGAPFIVMELLDGHDLAAELQERKSLPVDSAVSWILQACEAIAEAHAAGIVHRDLKPANLFLSTNPMGAPSVKVLDFGISKITRRDEHAATTDDKALTNAGSMLGSPLYMSPEQMKASAEVDARTDIWSLGVILYELVTGRSPFDAKTIPVICASVLSQAPPPLGVADAPNGFERIVLRCLEKEPENRFRDVAHLVRALAPFAPEQAVITLERVTRLRDDSGELSATPATVPPPSKEGSLTITSWNAKPDPLPKRRWRPVALAGAALATLVIGAFALQSALLDRHVATQDDEASLLRVSGEEAMASHEDEVEIDPQAPAATPMSDIAEAGATSSAPGAPLEAPLEEPSADVVDLDDPSASATADATAAARPPARPWPRPTQPKTSKTSKTAGFGGRE